MVISQAKTNKNSVPYDPLTLKYNDSIDGLRLLYVPFFTPFVFSVYVLLCFVCVKEQNSTALSLWLHVCAAHLGAYLRMLSISAWCFHLRRNMSICSACSDSDNVVKYRGAIRARNLQMRAQHGEFDLISGVDKPFVPEPQPPTRLVPDGKPRF